MQDHPNSPDDNNLSLLLQYLIGFCADLIEKYGEYFPIGAYLNLGGEIIPVGLYDGVDMPESEQVIRQYESLFGQEPTAGNLLAWAIAYDVQVQSEDYPDGTDAVAIKTFQSGAREQLLFLFPYKIVNGEADFAEDNWAEAW